MIFVLSLFNNNVLIDLDLMEGNRLKKINCVCDLRILILQYLLVPVAVASNVVLARLARY